MRNTVNELLVLKAVLQKRQGQVQNLLTHACRRTVSEYPYREPEQRQREVSESRYDPDDLEHKNAELNLALYEIDRVIKVANAITVVEVEVDVKSLLAPVKPRPWRPDEDKTE